MRTFVSDLTVLFPDPVDPITLGKNYKCGAFTIDVNRRTKISCHFEIFVPMAFLGDSNVGVVCKGHGDACRKQKWGEDGNRGQRSPSSSNVTESRRVWLIAKVGRGR
jgi:hypothetical protein